MFLFYFLTCHYPHFCSFLKKIMYLFLQLFIRIYLFSGIMIMICLDIVSFSFFCCLFVGLVGAHWDYFICGFIGLIKFGKVLVIISLNICSVSPFDTLKTAITYKLCHYNVPTVNWYVVKHYCLGYYGFLLITFLLLCL